MLTATPWGLAIRSLRAGSIRSSCEHTFVRRKDAEREEARRLRRQLGWSVARIARELGVAKSSVSVWVRDLGPRRSSAGPPPRPPGALPVRRLLVWRSGRLRRCGRCRHELPLECFNRLGDGHQWWCRTCFAAYFRARGELHRDQSKAAKRARTRSLRAHVLEYLRGHPCVDCGESDPVVLEFDHIGDKTAAIAALVSDGAPLKTIDTEIARCEVVCASCHKRRTARRARWRRAGPGNPSRRMQRRRSPVTSRICTRYWREALASTAASATRLSSSSITSATSATPSRGSHGTAAVWRRSIPR